MRQGFFTHAADVLFWNGKPNPKNIEKQLTLLKNKLQKVFAHLNLPEPLNEQDNKEFLKGSGNAGVAFLHRAGLVMRVLSDHTHPLLRHENLMRPIGSIRLSDHARIDIQYTGLCPVSQASVILARDSFSEAGLMVADTRPDNLCYLPQSGSSPSKTPIVFDPSLIQHIKGNAVRSFTASAPSTTMIDEIKIVDLWTMPEEAPDAQDINFAVLRARFLAMFERDDNDCITGSRPALVDAFWHAAIEAREQGLLNPSWMNAPDYTDAHAKGVKQISKNYDQRLCEHNRVFADDAGPNGQP